MAPLRGATGNLRVRRPLGLEEPHMDLEVGKKYYQKRGLCGAVRQVLALQDGKVDYRVLHGPARKRLPSNTCSARKFLEWLDGEFEGEDYNRLDGALLHGTYVVENL